MTTGYSRDEQLDFSAETYGTIAYVRLAHAGVQFDEHQLAVLREVMRLARRDAAGIGEGYAFADVAGGKSCTATCSQTARCGTNSTPSEPVKEL